MSEISMSTNIEDEADLYFKRVYDVATPRHSLSVNELLRTLKRLKNSRVERERVNSYCYKSITYYNVINGLFSNAVG